MTAPFYCDALVAVALVIAAAVFAYTRHQFAHWKRYNIPFVAPRFPFGNFGDQFLQRSSFGDVVRQLYASSDAPLLGFWTALSPALIVRAPALIRAICITDFENFSDRGLYADPERDPLSGHLFALPGERWRELRAKLTPTFTSGKLKAMFATLVACGQPLRAHIRRAADDGRTVEMRELLAQYTTNAIASVAFGLEIDCIAEPETAFRRYGRKIVAPSVWSNVRNLVMTFAPGLMAPLRMRLLDADVEAFFRSIVQQNIVLRENGGVVRPDFFQLLMQLRNGGLQEDGVWHTKATTTAPSSRRAKQGSAATPEQLSVNECAAQSFVFFVAGSETSATTVSFALYELARNQECQRRVQREIDRVLAAHGGELTYDAVAEMKYLDWCLDGERSNC